MRLKLSVVLPPDTKFLQPVRTEYVKGAFIERSMITRPGGLTGGMIHIDGLSTMQTDVLVRIEQINGTVQVERLTPTVPSFLVSRAPKTIEVAETYLVFGVEHILQGWDHLLFVACLVLIAGSWRRTLITVTGFTIAHSVTLTLAALGLVRLPLPPIEAAIALSIVFLAREIVQHRRDTITWQYPVAVSASFGLLHGFGFAAALKDIGLPQTEIPAALFSFNIGVEIGQIVFVVVVMMLSKAITEINHRFNEASQSEFVNGARAVGYCVGAVAMYWTVERMIAF
jgi:hydrogenase/urease accessory protein HupE